MYVEMDDVFGLNRLKIVKLEVLILDSPKSNVKIDNTWFEPSQDGEIRGK